MYVIVWEFIVRPDRVGAFVAAYRSDGAWAKLFARADGYLGTELLRSIDGENGPRFVTVDRWRSPQDFAHFQQLFGTEYRNLDTQLEGLTLSESKLGTFAREGERNMADEIEILKRLYECLNRREMETVLAALDENVVWANGMEGGHVRGRDGVREYWTRQWAMVDPRVEPAGFSKGTEGEIVVEVHQVVRDLSGGLLADQMVGHIFRIEDGLVRRFDIRGA